MGGMTAGDHVRYAVHDLAAMEPARNGRDDVGPVRRPPAGQDAAMEPARNGRDDPGGRLPAAAGGAAAMEPARNGRDDGGVPGDRVVIASRPQWSPPVMGGMTARVIDPPSQVQVPQWSPPVMGGMTVRRSGVPWQAHHGRNGARP